MTNENASSSITNLNPDVNAFNPKEFNAGCLNFNYGQQDIVNTSLLPHLSVLVLNGKGEWVTANVMIDGGSNCTLIRNRFAVLNGLTRDKTHIVYEVVGGQKKQEDTQLYQVKIIFITLC